jgi:hypothetical protein
MNHHLLRYTISLTEITIWEPHTFRLVLYFYHNLTFSVNTKAHYQMQSLGQSILYIVDIHVHAG